MIDFRTENKGNTNFIFIGNGSSNKGVGIYDNGLVFHYGRELSDKEIAWIERRHADAKKAKQLLEEKQFDEFTNKVELAIDELVKEKLDAIITKAFSQ